MRLESSNSLRFECDAKFQEPSPKVVVRLDGSKVHANLIALDGPPKRSNEHRSHEVFWQRALTIDTLQAGDGAPSFVFFRKSKNAVAYQQHAPWFKALSTITSPSKGLVLYATYVMRAL